MAARQPAPAPDATEPLDPASYLQHRILLKALHFAVPVMHEGKQQFLQVLSARRAGGRIEMDVYLAGVPGAIDSSEITLAEPAKENGNGQHEN